MAREIVFDESFPAAAAEDIDLCHRADLTGWRIMHCEQARVAHDFGYDALSAPLALRRMWRAFRRYARGERLLLEKHPAYFHVFAGSKEIPCLSDSGFRPH